MTKLNKQGIWSLFIPGLLENDIYKYQIKTAAGDTILKSDPYAFYSEIRPNTASIIYDLEGYKWQDQKWFQNKKRKLFMKNPLPFMRYI